MDDPIECVTEAREAVRPLAMWRKTRMHRLGAAHLDTNELEARLVERAEARRRRAICTYLNAMGVANTARSNRATIKRIWSGVEHRFGPAPDPSS